MLPGRLFCLFLLNKAPMYDSKAQAELQSDNLTLNRLRKHYRYHCQLKCGIALLPELQELSLFWREMNLFKNFLRHFIIWLGYVWSEGDCRSWSWFSPLSCVLWGLYSHCQAWLQTSYRLSHLLPPQRILKNKRLLISESCVLEEGGLLIEHCGHDDCGYCLKGFWIMCLFWEENGTY